MRKARLVGVRVVVFGIVLVGIAGLTVYLLWNALMPQIFHLAAIGYWQALGLLVFSRILFGGFGGWGRRMRRGRFVHGWKDMTPEERERFRSAMGMHGPEAGESKAGS